MMASPSPALGLARRPRGEWGRAFVLAALAAVTAGLLLAALGAARPAAAQDAAAGAFARTGFGARGIGMGNAQIADISGEASVYYNPALTPFIEGQRVLLSAALMTFDRSQQFAEFATPIGPTAGVAVGLVHAGVTGIDGRNRDGFATGELSTDEFAFFLAFGNRFAERLSVGASLKLFTADYGNDVDAPLTLGVDLGAVVEVTDRLQVAASVHDLLAQYNWDTSDAAQGGGRQNTDRFPVRVQLGAAHTFREGRLRVAAEYESRLIAAERRVRVPTSIGGTPGEAFRTEDVRFYRARLRLGAAYQPVEILSLRAGLDRLGAGDGLASARPSAGFGVDQTLGDFRVHAAYTFVLEPYVRDPMHLLTLRFFL